MQNFLYNLKDKFMTLKTQLSSDDTDPNLLPSKYRY